MIYGERIKQVRELMGWTQSELASKLEINQPIVAKLEGDRIAASDKFIERLSLISGFPPAFFSREPDSDFPAGTLLFRSHSAMTVKEASEIYRCAHLTFTVLRTMLTKKKFRDFPFNLQIGLSNDPRQAAAITRSELGLSPDKPITHLINSLEKAGVLVLALPKTYEHRDAFSLWAGADRSRPVIVLAGGKSGDRIRMNVAHELGHLVMHKPLLNAVQEVEKQAFQFAAEFLMPERQMRLEIIPPVTLDSLANLKQRWGVAIQALVVRAKELEIINQRKYTYLFQKLSARGWRMREPRMYDVPVEQPRALRQVAEIVYGLPIHYKKLAEDVAMPEPFVRSIVEAHAKKKAEQLPERTAEKTKGGVVPFDRSKAFA